jgi:hypothetical protein
MTSDLGHSALPANWGNSTSLLNIPTGLATSATKAAPPAELAVAPGAALPLLPKIPGDPVVRIESAPDLNSDYFGPWGFRISIDPRRGFMPAVVEIFQNASDGYATRSRMTVNAWTEINKGLYVPTRVTTDEFADDPVTGQKYGSLAAQISIEVDLKRSTWNRLIPEETFSLPLPAGTAVADSLRGVRYVAGKSEPGANLTDLAASARGIVPVSSASPLANRRAPAPPEVAAAVIDMKAKLNMTADLAKGMEPKPLRDAVEDIRDLFDVTTKIDAKAFQKDLGIVDVDSFPVSLPVVRSVSLKEIMQRISKQVRGVCRVNGDHLEIVPWTRAWPILPLIGAL